MINPQAAGISGLSFGDKSDFAAVLDKVSEAQILCISGGVPEIFRIKQIV